MKRFLLSVLSTSVCAAAGASAESPARVVLPANVQPEHYRLELTTDPARLRFRGKVDIRLAVKQPTRTIVMNAADLVFDKMSLANENLTPSVTLQPEDQTATFTFARPLSPGRHTLSLAYHGRIYQQASGLFALDYAGPAGAQKRALFTQFENSDARRVLPSWDEPGVKSTFTLVLHVPAGDAAVSNMPIERSEALKRGMKRVRFQTTPKMSAYLLFFALGDFERVHKQVGKTDVGIVVKRGDASRARFALDTVAQVLPYYDDYFGTPYPLPKLDIVGGPGASQFFGAMENWGAIFHFEHALLVDPRISTEAEKQSIYLTIAHEVAHQWFGDLVTMAWWDDLWLNEGFASWMEHKASDHFHPEWKVWLQSLPDVQATMQTDAASGTHPIVTPIRDVLEASNAFDDITYTKGQAVIRMLEAYVGEDVFRSGVRAYIQAFAYGNTTTDDFWRHIDKVSPKKITGIAHDFTLQAGVPLVAAGHERCEKGMQTVILTQGRFSLDDSGKGGAQSWHVPVAIEGLGNHARVSKVVSANAPASAAIRGCQAVILNAGQTGYFRTRYTPAAFAMLAAKLPQLSPADQVGLLEDTAALAFIGRVPMADFLNLTRRLPVSAEPVVWSALAGRIEELDMRYDGLPTQRAFRAYAISLLRPVFAPLGWDRRPDESDNAAVLRANLLAVLGRMGDPKVSAEARKRFRQFVAKPGSVTAAARKSALNIVAQNADAGIWEQLRQLARNAASELEKTDFYGLLGSAADPQLAERALQLSLTNEAPATLRPSIIDSVAVRFPRRAMDFAMNHWNMLGPQLEAGSRQQFVPILAASSSDPADIERLNEFAEAHIPRTGRSVVEKTVARIRYNAQLRSRLADVDRWLESSQRKE